MRRSVDGRMGRMGLFAKKEERYLGVDIGAGGMMLVELLLEGGRYKLMT